MPGATEMGHVVVAAKVENVMDLGNAAVGSIALEDVRRLDIKEALVDTGASNLALPTSMIEKLGLLQIRNREMMTANGIRTFRVFGAVRLTVHDRDCTVDVSEVDDGCPVLIGQVPLELMDWVVDPKNQRLVGNPDHDGKWVLDMM